MKRYKKINIAHYKKCICGWKLDNIGGSNGERGFKNSIKLFWYCPLLLFCLLFSISCKKFVEIPEPGNTLTTAKVFSTDNLATAAILGIYSDMAFRSGLTYSRGGGTIFLGLSADELNLFSSGNVEYFQFQENAIQSNNGSLTENFWTPAYYHIYLANAVIEGLSASPNISTQTKKRLTGEAKFLRAFCHFYLVNLFGDVPLITSTDWAKTSSMGRTPTDQVYQQIIADLEEARDMLSDEYSTMDERIRANKYAVSALLARAYLYAGEYGKAEVETDTVINNRTGYRLEDDLNNVFLKQSSEAIWQLRPDNYFPFAVYEGNQIIPYSSGNSPNYSLTTQLLSSFEIGDQRRSAWVDSTDYEGVRYFYPNKYKIRQGTPDVELTEYYTVLRLSEQYLIRAEARARKSDLTGAVGDLNVLRVRAGLPELPKSLTQNQVFDAVMQERRVELFAEWGHRWLDLKRTGRAGKILALVKGANWKSTSELYPIPLSEMSRDPNLIQNKGY